MTTKQEQVVKLLLNGLSHKEVATNLGVPETTISSRVRDLKRKYNLKNDVQIGALLKREKLNND